MVDYKKTFKSLYLPKEKPEIIEVPEMLFAVIEGEGDPNSPEFSKVTEALYSFSYAVKMSYKSETVPSDYYEYKVFPLEGVWDLIDPSKGNLDKSNFKYKLMIRQPDFLTEEWFSFFLELSKKKKPNAFLECIQLLKLSEGTCCQMLHSGPYDTEPVSFQTMEAYCNESGFTRQSKVHREIYLSDPRKTVPEKLKTVLRFQCR